MMISKIKFLTSLNFDKEDFFIKVTFEMILIKNLLKIDDKKFLFSLIFFNRTFF